VKRLLYQNADAEFVFCAGDDKVRVLPLPACPEMINTVGQTDEDMFRALLLFPTGVTKATMMAPLSVTLLEKQAGGAESVELAISPEAVFTTAVGHSSKRTLASWHVTTPAEIVDHMLHIDDEPADGSKL
jgi:trehalose 6-phosphate synthase/phosphatase